MRVIIIGGVAAGPKVGAKINRICPDADITLVEKGEFLSYAGCGLPYYIAGEVKEQKELMCTAVGVVRDPVFFQDVKNLRVLNKTEAIRVDREQKTVLVRDLRTGEEKSVAYDKLILATGSLPIRPPLAGITLPNVFSVHKVEDAEAIRAVLAENKARDVVVVGGGLIGLEMTEALARHGARITIVERLPAILPMMDKDLVVHVMKYLESRGVKVRCSTAVQSFEGNGRVEKVRTEQGDIPCDMVIVAVGVRPNTGLAREAGLEIGKTGGIKVTPAMQTSDPDIYAAGDCTEGRDLITGEPAYIPLGSTANKQGRVAAVNICGSKDMFPGILGTAVVKVFDHTVARTGLGEEQARQAGFDVVTVLSPAPDKAHYYPAAKTIMMKLIADKGSRRLLGLQVVGPGEGDKRVDVAATAITAKMTVDDVAHLDLAYAPPYSPAMDNIITACDIARNKMDGIFEGITPAEIKALIDCKADVILLDVRSPGEVQALPFPGSVNIPLGDLRKRSTELPRDKEIIAFCKISLRGYEAAMILKGHGFTKVKVMDGGLVMWPF
jgi:NADPH-dependent 2,4-dienoyl-CoA reductase/sulfur reductase-like enzyme/rhodanese-related sulfurtransferase